MGKWNLPTFEGEKDRTAARKMIDSLGGADNIRTKITVEADGSRTTLRTRNGFPHIKTDTKEAELPDSALSHGLVVDLKAPGVDRSFFYTKGKIGQREARTDVVQQSGVGNYFPDKVEQVYSLADSGQYLWDLRKVALGQLVVSTSDTRYGNHFVKGSNEISLSLPVLHNGGYYTVTPVKVVNGIGESLIGELSVANIGTEPTTMNATPPVVREDGSIHLSGYKTLVISSTFNIVEYKWSGIKLTPDQSGYLSASFSSGAVAPVAIESSSSQDVGVGAFDDIEPSVWWKNVTRYPSGWSGIALFGEGGTTIHTVVDGGVEEMFEPSILSESGWHFKEVVQRRCAKSVPVDTQPTMFEIDANYDFVYRSQRSSTTERVDKYNERSAGFGYPLAYVNLHEANFTQNGIAKITAKIGDLNIELLSAKGGAVANGADNRWERVGTSNNLPLSFPEGGIYYFVANGKELPTPLSLSAMMATFEPMPSLYPAVDYFNKTDTRTESVLFNGSANCEAVGFFVTDCDTKTVFVAGIECVVKANASFSAANYDGIWDYGDNYKIPHVVEIYFSWTWRGVKRRKLLVTDTVTKRPAFPVRLRPNPFLPDSSDIPLAHLTFPEFQMGEETFRQLETLRNHQGINPCFAGYSEDEETVANNTGVVFSYGSVRPKNSGSGMVYHRVIKPGELANCVWLLDSMKISEPISLAPLEIDPAKTRPYGFSDILYNAIFNTEYRISLLDGAEYDWPSTLTADPSATFVCKRV